MDTDIKAAYDADPPPAFDDLLSPDAAGPPPASEADELTGAADHVDPVDLDLNEFVYLGAYLQAVANGRAEDFLRDGLGIDMDWLYRLKVDTDALASAR